MQELESNLFVGHRIKDTLVRNRGSPELCPGEGGARELEEQTGFRGKRGTIDGSFSTIIALSKRN